MLLFYSITTKLYFFAIRVASLFNKKASLLVRGQKNWRQNLSAQIKDGTSYIWFHCASLGEFEQGRPLIEKFKNDPLTKDIKIVLSFLALPDMKLEKTIKVQISYATCLSINLEMLKTL